jgi:hypothetical protein
MRYFIRTCQECGLIQKGKDPTTYAKGEGGDRVKCRRCKSEGLDYGRWAEGEFIDGVFDEIKSLNGDSWDEE